MTTTVDKRIINLVVELYHEDDVTMPSIVRYYKNHLNEEEIKCLLSMSGDDDLIDDVLNECGKTKFDMALSKLHSKQKELTLKAETKQREEEAKAVYNLRELNNLKERIQNLLTIYKECDKPNSPKLPLSFQYNPIGRRYNEDYLYAMDTGIYKFYTNGEQHFITVDFDSARRIYNTDNPEFRKGVAIFVNRFEAFENLVYQTIEEW